jgi:F-type H+-transporting ATPase subunit epsilon
MADTMQFDLVSPEKMLASLQASEIDVPGSEGDFTAMPDHAAMITTLRPGLLKVTSAGSVTEYIVTGGFVEVNAGSVSVLAENAIPKGDATRDIVFGLISDAEDAAKLATDSDRDASDKRVADTKALLELLSL